MASDQMDGGCDQERSKCCFLEWMEQQEQDLSELQEAQSATPRSDARLADLAEKALSHFDGYARRRSELSRTDAAAFYAPTWCTPWENSLMWIAGCRPSSFFRLVYSLGSGDVESRLSAFLSGRIPPSDLGELSDRQLPLVDELHRRTVRAEDRLTARLTARLAGLQEEVADRPVAAIARETATAGDMSRAVDAALDAHERAMAAALEEADTLRLATVRQILAILTPAQAVDFLATSKKLHLCLHKWSKSRDQRHGRHPNH